MTISEMIIGLIGLMSSWAICCLLGLFMGLHMATKKELEDKKNDRSNL